MERKEKPFEIEDDKLHRGTTFPTGNCIITRLALAKSVRGYAVRKTTSEKTLQAKQAVKSYELKVLWRLQAVRESNKMISFSRLILLSRSA